ncbi:CoA pyrophosphatase [Nesterenkonia lutea]|uniref:8-oxo-dGTP pyrophosphatase MutT (NUDIX family) n=1 Tax=Nesterenkonia lutea TaxID=272919 RepID=A0ABR9JHM1_9MICC|nr:CoA pyrophosphatase [Nesterenkonia lutea]MBE1525434.1 8-oxo-dGTP pyrophosphatase MutT (NUDIX family) [Nesterenkonia lutea]
MRDADPAQKAGLLPAEHPDLSLAGSAVSTRLQALVQQGRDYADEHPESSSHGGWWNLRPSTRAPAETPAGMENARPAAVLMLFCAPTPGDDAAHLLLTERSPGLKKHPGQIAFPGGAQEDFDLDPTAAALREAQEEIGLDPARVRVLGALPPAPVPISGFMVTPVIGVAGQPGTLTPQTGEVERVLPVRLEQLIRPENRCTTVLHRPGAVFRAPAFLVEGTLIWGFTGILVDRLLNRLGWEQPWDAAVNVDPRDHLPGL